MTMISVDQSLFHLALQEIAEGAHVHAKGDQLVIGEQGTALLTAEQMAHVLGFIRSHAHLLEQSDRKLLTQLQSRLSSDVPPNTRQDIQMLFQELHRCDPNKVGAKLSPCPRSLQSTCASIDLSHSSSLLYAELSKTLEDPRLVLTGHLSVVREVPAKWNATEIVEALKKARAELGQGGLKSRPLCHVIDRLIERHQDPPYIRLIKLTQALQDPSLTVTEDLSIVRSKPKNWDISKVLKALQDARAATDPKNVLLVQALDRLIAEHQPPKVVKLGFCIEQTEGGDFSGAVGNALKSWLARGLPVLTTKALLTDISQYPHVQFYSQKQGGLALGIPYDTTLEKLGINAAEFEEVPKEAKRVKFESFDHQNDLKRALISTDKKGEIHRLIVAIGHGSPMAVGEARICGLPAAQFQEMLQVLSENGLAFFNVISCFSGGENATQISVPKGTIPCPMMLLNATESIALGNPEQYGLAINILDKARAKLFAPLPSGRTPMIPHPLHQKTLREIGSTTSTIYTQKAITSYADEITALQNIQTIFMPTQQGDIPNITYIGALPGHIMDVDAAIHKQRRTRFLSPEKQIQINVNEHVYTLFCSAPHLPASLAIEGKYKVGLIARGGNSVHFIDELRIPNLTLSQFVLSSSNKVARFAHGSPARLLGANKLYVIDTLQCRDEAGSLQQLHHVVISLTVTKPEVFYTDSEGQCYRREIKLNLSQDPGSILFGLPDSALSLGPEAKVDAETAIFRNLEQFLHCRPSEKHLLATTAGQVSVDDLSHLFLDKMQQTLNPAYVELYRLALDPKAGSRLVEKIKQLPLEAQRVAVDHALRLAILADRDSVVAQLLTHFGPWDRPLIDGKTALHLAAERGCLSVAKRLLKESPTPDLQDEAGRTPLHYAVIGNNLEMVKILSERCSEMTKDSVGRSPLDYALINCRMEITKKLLSRSSATIEGKLPRRGLLLMCQNPSFLQSVIASKRIPMTGPFLEGKSFLESYLRFPHQLSLLPSLKLLFEHGCAEAETLDDQGHSLVMRLLLDKVSLGDYDDWRMLQQHFPLSEADKRFLAHTWLTKNPIGILNLMKALAIPPEPADEWQKVLTKEFALKFDPKMAQHLIDLGFAIPWQDIGLSLRKMPSDKLDSVMNLIDKYRPNLSNDKNWRDQWMRFLDNDEMNYVSLLSQCGVRPFIPQETVGMTGEQLLNAVQEDPERISWLVQSLAAGTQIDPTSAAAKACLVRLFVWPQTELNLSAIKMLTERGVTYDPSHQGIPPATWTTYNREPFDVWMNASYILPEVKQNPQLKSLINAEIQSGHLTTEQIGRLYIYNIPFDYKLLSDDLVIDLLTKSGGESVLATLKKEGIKISPQMATKVFAQLLVDGQGSATFLKALSEYGIENRDLLLRQYRDKLLQNALPSYFLPDWLIPKLELLIGLGGTLELNESVLQLLDKESAKPLLDLVLAHPSGQVKLEGILNFKPIHTEWLSALIRAGRVAADDPKLDPLAMRGLELSRYEKGVQPSKEECLRRYWTAPHDPLRDVIRRDLKPDPKSAAARAALSEALHNKTWDVAKRLLELGVPLQMTEQIKQNIQSAFDEFISDDLIATLRLLLDKGIDVSFLRESLQKRVASILQNSSSSFEIRRLDELITALQPIVLSSPAPCISYDLQHGIHVKTWDVFARLNYDFKLHKGEIVKKLSEAQYSPYMTPNQEIALIKYCPSVIEPDTLPRVLKSDVPIALLSAIEKLGGNKELLKAHCESLFPALLEKVSTNDDLSFLERYVDDSKWKKTDCAAMIKKLLSKDDELLTGWISLAIRKGDMDELKGSLSKIYSSAFMSKFDPEKLLLLLDANIPISKQDKEDLHEILIKYDNLKIAKQLNDKPGNP